MRRVLDAIGADRELLGISEAKKIAHFLAEKQREKTIKSIKKVLSTIKKRYRTNMRIAAIAGAGKDIILRKVLEDLGFEEIIDVEKAASKEMDLKGPQINCETSLGCAVRGLKAPF